MHRYATRNHAFGPAVEWVLDEAVLRRADGQGPPQVYVLQDVREMRLEFAPTRPEPKRYRCRLRLRSGQGIEFFNRTYRGVMDFADTSADYTAFVRALHAALARHSPGCQFIAGKSQGAFAFNLAVLMFVAVVLAAASVFFLTVGLIWIALLKVGLIAFYTPTALAWVKRNRPRGFGTQSILPDVLPLSPS